MSPFWALCIYLGGVAVGCFLSGMIDWEPPKEDFRYAGATLSIFWPFILGAVLVIGPFWLIIEAGRRVGERWGL